MVRSRKENEKRGISNAINFSVKRCMKIKYKWFTKMPSFCWVDGTFTKTSMYLP